jgi:hypothetical protein
MMDMELAFKLRKVINCEWDIYTRMAKLKEKFTECMGKLRLLDMLGKKFRLRWVLGL